MQVKKQIEISSFYEINFNFGAFQNSKIKG